MAKLVCCASIVVLLASCSASVGQPRTRARDGLSYDAFLPLVKDSQARKAYWRAYRYEMRELLKLGRVSKPTRLVRGTGRARWHGNGLVEVPIALNDVGVVYHEMFHGAFHNSALDRGENRRWADGFCDAYRFFMETRNHARLPTPWLKKARKSLSLSPAQAIKQLGDNVTVRHYIVPMTLIVKHVGTSYRRFVRLWRHLAYPKPGGRVPRLSTLLGWEFGPKARTPDTKPTRLP